MKRWQTSPSAEHGAAGAHRPAPRSRVLVRAANARDGELLNDLLGAYTPQELPLPLPRGAGELRVVEVLRSEPLRIEYVVESRATGLRHVGELEVGDSTGTTITASRLQRLP